MTTPKFTPGPWHVVYDDHNGQAVVSGPQTAVATCWHHCVGSLEKEMRHNARLIAAAPEMYEALEMAMPELRLLASKLRDPDETRALLGIIKALLAKINGDDHA